MIDKRKHYVLMIDTETANTLVDEDNNLDMSNVLVYDCGWAVIDTKGNLYETASYINADIFIDEKELMRTAYYAEKIPRYEAELKQGLRKLATTRTIRQAMLDTIEKYGIKEVVAHNARFDANALNVTERFNSCSKYRYWFPFDTVIWWDTLKMASDVICNMPTYRKFCEDNGYFTPSGQLKRTAEILYRFISGGNDFIESHTGLEDVMIEAEILWYCFRQHKKMRKALYDTPIERTPASPFQKKLLHNLKETPSYRREF